MTFDENKVVQMYFSLGSVDVLLSIARPPAKAGLDWGGGGGGEREWVPTIMPRYVMCVSKSEGYVSLFSLH